MPDALSHLRDIGSVSDLQRLAATTPLAVLPNNAHVHLPPNFSGFAKVRKLLDSAGASRCDVVGASNYYDFTVYRDFAQLARKKNVFPLFGTEIICMIDEYRAAGIKINDPGNPGKMYVCGKGLVKFEQMTTEAARILGIIRKNDSERMRKMVEKLAQLLTEYGLPNHFTADWVIKEVAQWYRVKRETVFLQERHVAMALALHVSRIRMPSDERNAKLTTLLGTKPKREVDGIVGLQNEVRSHLMKAGKPGFVEETFIDFDSAVRLIRELGGFVSYPILADGANPICPFETPVEKLIRHLQERRIFAAELIPNRNAAVTVASYAKALRAAGILVTAGTEHNTMETMPMVPSCLNNEPIPADLAAIFYEGACVIAAHQFLAAHGQAGFAGQGIDQWAALGNAVIRRYLEGIKRPA